MITREKRKDGIWHTLFFLQKCRWQWENNFFYYLHHIHSLVQWMTSGWRVRKKQYTDSQSCIAKFDSSRAEIRNFLRLSCLIERYFFWFWLRLFSSVFLFQGQLVFDKHVLDHDKSAWSYIIVQCFSRIWQFIFTNGPIVRVFQSTSVKTCHLICLSMVSVY